MPERPSFRYYGSRPTPEEEYSLKRKTIAIALSLFLVTPLAAQAATYETEVESGVNFRSKPSTQSYTYRMIPKGEDIHVIDQYNSYWLKIQAQDGTIGYISANSKYTDYGDDSPSGTTSSTSSSSVIADRIITHSKSLMGKVTYDFGTRNPSALIFDCSSFTEYVFEKQGIDLRWGTRYQQYAGTYVSKSTLKKGDLVFFGTSSRSTVNHVGIYIGGGQFIHNSPSSDGIQINTLNSGYWEDRYIKARRVL
jgi:cell wall-associated NlpC family hydrolase